jgi:hypothetical protein
MPCCDVIGCMPALVDARNNIDALGNAIHLHLGDTCADVLLNSGSGLQMRDTFYLSKSVNNDVESHHHFKEPDGATHRAPSQLCRNDDGFREIVTTTCGLYEIERSHVHEDAGGTNMRLGQKEIQKASSKEVPTQKGRNMPVALEAHQGDTTEKLILVEGFPSISSQPPIRVHHSRQKVVPSCDPSVKPTKLGDWQDCGLHFDTVSATQQEVTTLDLEFARKHLEEERKLADWPKLPEAKTRGVANMQSQSQHLDGESDIDAAAEIGVPHSEAHIVDIESTNCRGPSYMPTELSRSAIPIGISDKPIVSIKDTFEVRADESLGEPEAGTQQSNPECEREATESVPQVETEVQKNVVATFSIRSNEAFSNGDTYFDKGQKLLQEANTSAKHNSYVGVSINEMGEKLPPHANKLNNERINSPPVSVNKQMTSKSGLT